MKSNFLKIWFLAIRPQSLVASACPVIIGIAMAFGDGVFHLPTAGICFLAAICFQVITNMTNEINDYERGVDDAKPLGNTGLTQADLIRSGQMKWAVMILAVLALGLSAWVIRRAGWGMAVIAICSLAAAIFYTAGKKPLGYRGWGDLLVFLFFGPVATAGTYYAQSFEMNAAVLLAGIAPGLISTGVLVVNNIRDHDNDQAHGKNTLVVRFGQAFGRMEYLFCVIVSTLIPVIIYYLADDHKAILISSSISLIAIPNMHKVCAASDEQALNFALAFTGQLLVIYTALFSIGWIV